MSGYAAVHKAFQLAEQKGKTLHEAVKQKNEKALAKASDMSRPQSAKAEEKQASRR